MLRVTQWLWKILIQALCRRKLHLTDLRFSTKWILSSYLKLIKLSFENTMKKRYFQPVAKNCCIRCIIKILKIYSCRYSWICSCGIHQQVFIEHSLWERRVPGVNSISKSYDSLLMLSEHLQPDFAFISLNKSNLC